MSTATGRPVLATRDVASDADASDALDLGPLAGLVGYHMRRAAGALRGDYARAVEGAGMRQVLFGILSVISANPGINQGSVARALGIQRPNMVALVNELIDRGYLVRAVDAGDRRAFTLRLTQAGAAAVDETLARIRVHEERMLDGITANERSMLIRILERIETNG